MTSSKRCRFQIDEEENQLSIKIAGSIFPVIIMYIKTEIATIIKDMLKHPPKHPMVNSLVIWLIEYFINSNNMESHLGICFQCLINVL